MTVVSAPNYRSQSRAIQVLDLIEIFNTDRHMIQRQRHSAIMPWLPPTHIGTSGATPSAGSYDVDLSAIDLRLLISAPPDVVFDLSRSIDAHSASMSKSAERAVGSITEGHIELGEHVTWRARHFGFTFQMTSRIAEMDRPRRFVDEQVDGPFRHWRHVHSFEAEADGTCMVDTIDYEVPFGLPGRAVDRLFLNRYLTNLIAQRNNFIKQAAES
jgi:ligand-binding SRPBCC domain-containing protein